MNVYFNSVSGIDDALVALLMSKRTWNPDLDEERRYEVKLLSDSKGRLVNQDIDGSLTQDAKKHLETLFKIGKKHITLLRYIDFSFTVEGIHRAGQDDWDSHAKRFDNRIIRASTRLAKFGEEKSNFYNGKILTTDEAITKYIGIEIPEMFTDGYGTEWVKVTNGYVRKQDIENKDVLRGLYMLSIPSNFIFKINLCEWCHVYKERNVNSTANPEVKELCEKIADLIIAAIPYVSREYFLEVVN